MADDAFRDLPVLVTGASGFLGRHLVRRLRALGAQVACVVAALDRAPAEWRDPASGPIPLLQQADVADRDAVAAVFAAARPRRAFHLAARIRRSEDLYDLPGYIHVNTEGTACVLAACLRHPVDGLVVMGSGEEYGPDAPIPTSEDAPARPVTAYGISKAAATALCQAAHRAEGIPVAVLRAFLLYGPGQDTRFFVAALAAAAHGGLPVAMTPGEQTRDLLHVDDAVEALLRASGLPARDGLVANLCSGEERSLQEIAALWEKQTGMTDRIRRGALPYRRGEIFRYVGDPRRFMEAAGWAPRIPFEEGLRRLCQD